MLKVRSLCVILVLHEVQMGMAFRTVMSRSQDVLSIDSFITSEMINPVFVALICFLQDELLEGTCVSTVITLRTFGFTVVLDTLQNMLHLSILDVNLRWDVTGCSFKHTTVRFFTVRNIMSESGSTINPTTLPLFSFCFGIQSMSSEVCMATCNIYNTNRHQLSNTCKDAVY